jgi:prepilin-type N-terminal cleavage/methylation domain-containing protein/prepilin-type processing-associated H-X9-DG protein
MRPSNRRGFTLIELLVVIAIIAILAAILFPVFAQAREKARQTSCLSNSKQMGTGIAMYVQDYDETFPMAWGWHPAAGWLYSYVHYTPQNWAPISASAQAAYGLQWINSTQSYMKNYGIAQCPSGRIIPFPGVNYGTQVVPAQNTALTMNGLLSSYALAGVNAAASVPLVWEGNGKANIKGFGTANPALICDTPTSPCVFTPPSATACASGNGGTGSMFSPLDTMWVHSGGANFTFADSHVKWRRLGASLAPLNTDGNYDPYNSYNAQGIPSRHWRDNLGCHPWLFRPNLEPNS